MPVAACGVAACGVAATTDELASPLNVCTGDGTHPLRRALHNRLTAKLLSAEVYDESAGPDRDPTRVRSCSESPSHSELKQTFAEAAPPTRTGSLCSADGTVDADVLRSTSPRHAEGPRSAAVISATQARRCRFQTPGNRPTAAPAHDSPQEASDRDDLGFVLTFICNIILPLAIALVLVEGPGCKTIVCCCWVALYRVGLMASHHIASRGTPRGIQASVRVDIASSSLTHRSA